MVGLITVENPMNKDDLGVPLFQETTILAMLAPANIYKDVHVPVRFSNELTARNAELSFKKCRCVVFGPLSVPGYQREEERGKGEGKGEGKGGKGGKGKGIGPEGQKDIWHLVGSEG